MFVQVFSLLLFSQLFGNILARDRAVRISENCGNIHPAVLTQARGYDLADQSSSGPALKSPQKYLNPVFQFTCDQNKTYKNPFHGPKYQIPDQMNVMSLPAGKMSKTSHCFHDFKQLKEAVHKDIPDWEKYNLGSFTTTSGLPNSFDIPPTAKCLLRISNTVYELEARIERDAQLDPDFNSAFMALPETSKADEATYAKFIADYGTGFLERGYYANGMDLWVLTEGPMKTGLERVDDLLKSFKESTETDVGNYIKKNLEESFPGVNPTVFMRYSSPGRWSKKEVNLISGEFRTFNYHMLPEGTRLDKLEEAIEAHLTKAGLKKDWRGEWKFANDE